MDQEEQLMKDVELGTESEQDRLNEKGEEVSGFIEKIKDKFWGKTKPATSSKVEEFDIPGLWPSTVSQELCCIYRVPSRLRKVKPEAYTPQMLIIGPLHYSKINKAKQLAKPDSSYLDYLNMENHKTRYLNQFVKKYGDETVAEFKRIIQEVEKYIRESYAESTDWIDSKSFVEMILRDSIFILAFLIKYNKRIASTRNINKKKGFLFEQPSLRETILEDLVLLENQLPYGLLEALFDALHSKLETKEPLLEITLRAFKLEGKIGEGVFFRHFTDLFRRVRVQTLGLSDEEVTSMPSADQENVIQPMYSADKLDSAGVDFKNVDTENDLSLVIEFKDGVLKMPCFVAKEDNERLMRNLMALEQCHYPYIAFICNYVTFLYNLIHTKTDVDLLIKKGVVENWLLHRDLVKEMVMKMCTGLVDSGSYYFSTAQDLNNYYEGTGHHRSLPGLVLYWKNITIRSFQTLKQVYFKDLWTGTATVGAIILLVLTLIQTYASVLQVTHGDKK